MRNALIVAAAALALATPAVAHDYNRDFVCSITDIGGNKLIYAFANNTGNVDGSFGGTYVETVFSKNGRDVVSPTGSRPIWYFGRSPNRNWLANITSRDAPGWTIGVVGNGGQNGFLNYYAELWYNGRPMGRGACVRGVHNADGSVPANAVGDVAD